MKPQLHRLCDVRSTICRTALIAFLLTGCMTRGKFEARLQSWVGTDVNSLIESWGPPSGTYDLPDGRKMYTWARDQGTMALPTSSTSVAAVPVHCSVTFTVATDSRVQNWRYEGNHCY